jgi:hypothetical protein
MCPSREKQNVSAPASETNDISVIHDIKMFAVKKGKDRIQPAGVIAWGVQGMQQAH